MAKEADLIPGSFNPLMGRIVKIFNFTNFNNNLSMLNLSTIQYSFTNNKFINNTVFIAQTTSCHQELFHDKSFLVQILIASEISQCQIAETQSSGILHKVLISMPGCSLDQMRGFRSPTYFDVSSQHKRNLKLVFLWYFKLPYDSVTMESFFIQYICNSQCA